MPGEWLKRQEGFSLLETLVAAALMALISVAVAMVYSRARLSITVDTGSFGQIGAMRVTAQQLAKDLRQATAVGTAAACGGTPETALTLTVGGNSLTYSLSGSNLQRAVAGGNTVTISYPVSSLGFCLVSGTTFKTVQVTVASGKYSVTTQVAPRLLPNGQGATLE